jgi:hypothetical protein
MVRASLDKDVDGTDPVIEAGNATTSRVGDTNLGSLDPVGAGTTFKLTYNLHGLRGAGGAGGADRMAAREQPAGGIDTNISHLAAVCALIFDGEQFRAWHAWYDPWNVKQRCPRARDRQTNTE